MLNALKTPRVSKLLEGTVYKKPEFTIIVPSAVVPAPELTAIRVFPVGTQCAVDACCINAFNKLLYTETQSCITAGDV